MSTRRGSVSVIDSATHGTTAGKKTVGKEDATKNIGFLYSGNLDKRNPVSGSYKQRFVVLTHDAIHWFKRADHSALFGEERGQILLTNIRSTRIQDEDSTVCEIIATSNKKTLFRSQTPQQIEEWVSAIRSAVKSANASGPSKMTRRSSISAGISGIFGEHDEDHDEDVSTPEVNCSLVSFLSSAKAQQQVEIVMARSPDFGRLVSLPLVKPGDQVIISTSNGGTVSLTYELMDRYSNEDVDFELAVQNVPLASSLKLSLTKEIKLSRSPAQDYAEEKRKAGKELSSIDRLLQVIIVLTSERSSAISLVLSMMVMMAGMGSFRYIGVDTSMLFFMAALLSIYNLQQVMTRIEADDKLNGSSRGLSLQLIIISHSFTSPDEPINEPENDIPIAFINGCEGDMKEARRRWDITRHWREAEGVNNILNEPQPYYFLIKQMYPHFCCGWGKDGVSVIYNERITEFEKDQLAARGVGLDELFRHWLFCTEYQWQIICKTHSETAKGITIQDVKGISMGFLTGDNLTFAKKTIAIAGAHYPERSQAILVVNAPWISSAIWKMMSPLVHENTRKKVKILSASDTLEGLKEFIHEDDIPVYYGGKLDYGGKDSVRFNHPMQLEMDRYVRSLNEGLDGAAGGGGDGSSVRDMGTESPAPGLHSSESADCIALGDRGSGIAGEASNNARPTASAGAGGAGSSATPVRGTDAGSVDGRDWSIASNTTRASIVPPTNSISPFATKPVPRR